MWYHGSDVHVDHNGTHVRTYLPGTLCTSMVTLARPHPLPPPIHQSVGTWTNNASRRYEMVAAAFQQCTGPRRTGCAARGYWHWTPPPLPPFPPPSSPCPPTPRCSASPIWLRILTRTPATRTLRLYTRGSPVPVPARGATCPPRCTIGRKAAATTSHLRDAWLVQL
jgi:hypothetical protein